MKKSYYISYGLLHAAGVFVYTSAVAWLLFNGQRFFGQVSNFLLPLFLLLLFMVSATITGLLVLGRPAYLYFNGQRKEGVIFLIFTLGWMALFALAVVICLLWS